MNNHGIPPPGEMADTRLDQILAAATTELLGHIERNADPCRALTAIMNRNSPQVAPRETIPPRLSQEPYRSEAAAVISIRSCALDLALDLDSDLDIARELAHALARIRNPSRARDINRNRDLDHAYARVHDLDLTLRADLDSARNLALTVALDRDLARIRDLVNDLAHDLVSNLDRARALAQVRAVDVLRARVHDRTLVSILDRVLDLAHDIVRALAVQHVDASGADLSAMQISQLDALNGIIWTHRTTWPPDIAGAVWAYSDEIQPGIYQVRIGGSSGWKALVPV